MTNEGFRYLKIISVVFICLNWSLLAPLDSSMSKNEKLVMEDLPDMPDIKAISVQIKVSLLC